MRLIKRTEAREIKNSPSCTAVEYPLGDRDINGTLIILEGRYPEKGSAVNLRCKEIAYVIEGKGKLGIYGDNHKGYAEHEIRQGDMVFLSPGDKYYWEGKLKLFMPCAPAWYPEQHKEVS